MSIGTPDDAPRASRALRAVGAGTSRGPGLRDWLRVLEPIAIVALVGLLLLVTDIGCPFRFLLGVSCPGCGMTRAWLAFLTGDVERALALNPLFWAPVLAIALSVLAPRLGRWAQVAVLVLCLAVVGLWALRMALALGFAETPWIATLDPDVVAVTDPGILEWVHLIG